MDDPKKTALEVVKLDAEWQLSRWHWCSRYGPLYFFALRIAPLDIYTIHQHIFIRFWYEKTPPHALGAG
jgi:hypothetical protein